MFSKKPPVHGQTNGIPHDSFDHEPRLFTKQPLGQDYSQDPREQHYPSQSKAYPSQDQQEEYRGPRLVATNDEPFFERSSSPFSAQPYGENSSYHPSYSKEPQPGFPQENFPSFDSRDFPQREPQFSGSSYYPNDYGQRETPYDPRAQHPSYDPQEPQSYGYSHQPKRRDENPFYEERHHPTQEPYPKSSHFWPQDQHEEDDYENGEEEEWEDDEQSGPMRYVLAIAILVIVTVIGWFGFRLLTGSGSSYPPLIQAEQGPFKIRPDNPGGMMIPHQDKLVYKRLSPNQEEPTEQLIAPQEEVIVPQDQGYVTQGMQAPQGQPLMYVDQNGQVHQVIQQPQGYASVPAYAQGALAQPQNSQQGHVASQVPGGHNTIPAQSPTPQTPHGTIPYDQAYPNDVKQEPQPISTQQQNMTALEPSKQASNQEKISQEKKPQEDLEPALVKTEVIPSKETPKKTMTLEDVVEKTTEEKISQNAPKNKYRVQLASFKNKADAETEKARLLREKASLFSQVSIEIKKLKEDVYVLLAGSFITRSAASEFCKKLPQSKGIILPIKEGA